MSDKPAAVTLGVIDLTIAPSLELLKEWQEAARDFHYATNHLKRLELDVEDARKVLQAKERAVIKIRQRFAEAAHMADPLTEDK